MILQHIKVSQVYHSKLTFLPDNSVCVWGGGIHCLLLVLILNTQHSKQLDSFSLTSLILQNQVLSSVLQWNEGLS